LVVLVSFAVPIVLLQLLDRSDGVDFHSSFDKEYALPESKPGIAQAPKYYLLLTHEKVVSAALYETKGQEYVGADVGVESGHGRSCDFLRHVRPTHDVNVDAPFTQDQEQDRHSNRLVHRLQVGSGFPVDCFIGASSSKLGCIHFWGFFPREKCTGEATQKKYDRECFDNDPEKRDKGFCLGNVKKHPVPFHTCSSSNFIPLQHLRSKRQCIY